MVDSGRSTADGQNLRAAVVSVCDNRVSGHGRGARHGSCDFLGRFERNSRYRGSAPAEKRAERADLLSGCDHTWKKLNEFRAKWLMKVIGKTATHSFVIPRCECCRERARVRTVFYSSNA